MANQTIQNSIDFASTYIQYSPLSVGTASEPAITIANIVQGMITNAPFSWGWNRKEDITLNTVAGTQDYLVALTDFGFLEKVSLTDASGVVFEILDIKNTAALGKGDSSILKRQRPNAVCVNTVTFGTSVNFRFMGVPDKIYNVTLTYQKFVPPMSALIGANGTWTIPTQYSDTYNSLFLAEAMAVVDDARAQLYRQRGVTSLLGTAEGLTEMEKNAFLDQYWSRNNQQLSGTLRTQQGNTSRGI